MTEYEISPDFPTSGRGATFGTQRYPYYDADGDLAGTFAICRNVTERKQRERELERYERAITVPPISSPRSTATGGSCSRTRSTGSTTGSVTAT